VAEPRKLLSDFLREDLGLTGTHIGCEHGVCGCCTVFVRFPGDPPAPPAYGGIVGRPVRSCLVFAAQVEGGDITTVEGLSADPSHLTPVQECFSQHHGLQCGFCTPGMLAAATDFLRDHPAPTAAEVREAMSGQLCRCTGYEQIVRAVLAAAERIRGQAPAHRGPRNE